MTDINILEATKIILKSNSPKVSFRVPVTDSYSNVYDILIHESNSALTKELMAAGFSLSMSPKGLSVNKF